MIDSGAFTVWTKGKSIDIDEYLDFYTRYANEIDILITLDVIPGRPFKKITVHETEQAAQKGFFG